MMYPKRSPCSAAALESAGLFGLREELIAQDIFERLPMDRGKTAFSISDRLVLQLESSDEGAAVAAVLPVGAQALAAITVGHGVRGHGVGQLGERLIPDGFVVADLVAFRQRPRLNPGKLAAGHYRRSAMPAGVIRNVESNGAVFHAYHCSTLALSSIIRRAWAGSDWGAAIPRAFPWLANGIFSWSPACVWDAYIERPDARVHYFQEVFAGKLFDSNGHEPLFSEAVSAIATPLQPEQWYRGGDWQACTSAYIANRTLAGTRPTTPTSASGAGASVANSSYTAIWIRLTATFTTRRPATPSTKSASSSPPAKSTTTTQASTRPP